MDSGALLDLLGNENRRRILQLLARKPCYVTEIGDYLDVSPKAVIDHLRKLEDAGLVESRVDDQRRKYFHIARNLRLEVNVSPYSFLARSAYPASASLDITRCHHVSVNVEEAESDDVADLAAELDRLRDLERELSLAQRWAQGRIASIQEELGEIIDDQDHERLYAEILAELADSPGDTRTVAEQLDVPVPVVESAIHDLVTRDLLRQTESGWAID